MGSTTSTRCWPTRTEESAASELDAGNGELLRGLPTLDQRALVVYRRRLAAIADEIESADHVGDQDRSAALEDERAQVLAEVRRASGGGSVRTTSESAERARVNVTRNIGRALEQIQRAAPVAGWHLAASPSAPGTHCRYDPTPDGPEIWGRPTRRPHVRPEQVVPSRGTPHVIFRITFHDSQEDPMNTTTLIRSRRLGLALVTLFATGATRGSIHR